MSKIKWGAIVVDGRGKLGGHVFTKTRSGATMRTKVTPVNPQTTAQASARSRLGGNSQAWAQLSESQRRGWNELASESARTNIFGDQYFPTGKNLFTSVNNNLLLIGGAQLSDPPAFKELPFIVAMSASVAVATSSISLNITADGELGGSALVIEASKPLSKGRYNFDGTYRIISYQEATAPITPTALYNAYVAKFGAPSVGTKIGFRCYYISIATGQASPRFATTALV